MGRCLNYIKFTMSGEARHFEQRWNFKWKQRLNPVSLASAEEFVQKQLFGYESGAAATTHCFSFIRYITKQKYSSKSTLVTRLYFYQIGPSTCILVRWFLTKGASQSAALQPAHSTSLSPSQPRYAGRMKGLNLGRGGTQYKLRGAQLQNTLFQNTEWKKPKPTPKATTLSHQRGKKKKKKKTTGKNYPLCILLPWVMWPRPSSYSSIMERKWQTPQKC